jgi:probable phosphoglycerate mutase
MTPHSFKLILLRHGNTFASNEVPYQVGCKTDLPLTEKGLIQAHNFVSYLQDQKIDPYAIVAGSLQRQTQTAHIIHQAFTQAKLSTHQAALDEIDYGIWEKLTTESICAQWPKEYEAWHYQAAWPEGVFERSLSFHLGLLKEWIQSLAEQVPHNGTVVAVSSNGIIRLLLHFIPTLWQTLVDSAQMNEYKVGTGSFCILEFNNQIPTISQWNQAPLVVS